MLKEREAYKIILEGASTHTASGQRPDLLTKICHSSIPFRLGISNFLTELPNNFPRCPNSPRTDRNDLEREDFNLIDNASRVSGELSQLQGSRSSSSRDRGMRLPAKQVKIQKSSSASIRKAFDISCCLSSCLRMLTIQGISFARHRWLR